MKFTKSSQIFNALNIAIQQWLDETLAVLVLYKTPLNSSATFNSLTLSLNDNGASLDLLVYDNSPAINWNSPDYPNWKITYQHDPTNPGVSKAYNEGVKKASQLRKKWLFLLDQDTTFPRNTISAYFKSLSEYPLEAFFVPQLIDNRGIISPFKFGMGNGIRINSVMGGVHFFYNHQFVNSGLIISVNAYNNSNGYDEDFPLDFSDFAFIERVRRNYSSFVLAPVTAQHSLSSSFGRIMQDDLKRFGHLIRSAKLFREKYHANNWLIVGRPLLRALKLSIQYRSILFLTKYFQQLMKRD